jgi:hypothetical protein
MTKRPVIPLRNIVMYLICPVQQGVMGSMVLVQVLEVQVLALGKQMDLLRILDSFTNGITEDTINQHTVCKCLKVLQHPKDTLAITTATGIMFTSNLLIPSSHGTNLSCQALGSHLRVEPLLRDQNPHLRSSCNKLATVRQLSQILSTTHLIVAKWLRNKQQQRLHWRSRAQ